MPLPYFKSGTWNVICDSCGLLFHSDQILERWDGMKVCKADWEPRHPLDFVRGIPDQLSVPYARPKEAEDSIVTITGNDTLSSGVQSVYVTATATITLPAASSVTIGGLGFVLQVGAGITSVVLQRAGADTINLATSINLEPGNKYILTSDDVSKWTAI